MKKIVSFMLVLILSFGTVASICAQENDYSDNNLKGRHTGLLMPMEM